MANSRSVYKRDDGSWVNKRDDASRAGSVHQTQKAAEEAAREMLKYSGGGRIEHPRRGRSNSQQGHHRARQ
jgi:hypothetical protein